MRIAQYYTRAAEGDPGVRESLLAWSRALGASGVEVQVLHAPVSNPTVAPDVDLVAVPHSGRGRFRFPTNLHRALRPFDLVVLHEGWVVANLVAARAARRAGVPYVVMPHGVYEPVWVSLLRAHRPRRLIERWVLKNALAVHLSFESEIPNIEAIAPGARCIVAPTGVDLPEERWTGGAGEILWVGRYSIHNKGLDLLVEAVERLPPGKRPRLSLWGIDYQFDRMGGVEFLRDLVRSRGLGDDVEVGGFIPEAEKVARLSSCAGYVHPSRWDCQPAMLMQALSLGVPAVVSERLHIASLLKEHDAAIVTGLDPEALGKALLRLRDEPEPLSMRARQVVRDHFDWKRSVRRLLDGLESVGL
jgi:glycosyltransferase involved in cell wall biosynthesis